MSVYSGYDTQQIRDPRIKEVLDKVLDITAGHDHDGTNTKAVVGSVGDGVVTNTKLAADVKVGSLAALTTTTKTSVVGAINEIDTSVTALETAVGTVSTLTTTSKEVVGAINENVTSLAAKASLTGAQTLTNKTLTTPRLNAPVIGDGDTGITITSADQTNAVPVITIPDILDAADGMVLNDTVATLTLKTLTTPVIASIYQDAAKTKLMTVPDTASDTLAVIAATQTLTNKTLTTPVIASVYQDAGKTKLLSIPDTASDTLAAIAATQTMTNKTLTTPVIPSIYQDAAKTKLMTIPDTASDTLAAIAATQTLTNKILTAPVITSPAITLNASAHNYGGAAVEWTLSAAELKQMIIGATNANGAVNAVIGNTANIVYIVNNGTGFGMTVKTAAGTGITVANGKVAMVMSDGVNVIRVTLDA